ncbi:MAG: hypothetical protein VXZ72_01575 [Chlamydiota bacterium]|nr:hypothetical protein [Chlamydiota bacterium]
MGTTFKRREKFDIHAKIYDLKLDPRVADVLEHTRPLTNASLTKVSRNIEKIFDSIEYMKSRMVTEHHGFRLACAIEFAGTYTDVWSFAVIRGVAHRLYTGKYTEQEGYQALCLAAGSCLRAPAAEPFRLVLSIITKAGFRPPECDVSPTFTVGVALPPKRWQALADVYGSLQEVKGSQIVECLAIGLGCHLLDGKVDRREASRLFKTALPWRASSPIPQLVSKETKC